MLLASNRRVDGGEVDLLVRVDGRVVAVEVKTRIDADPASQVTESKLLRMAAAASAIRPRPGRIDLVTVRLDAAGATIRWLRGVA